MSAFSDNVGIYVSFVRVGELWVIIHIHVLDWGSNVIGLSFLVFIRGLGVEVGLLSYNRLVRVGVRFHVVVVLLYLLLCALLGN